MVYDLEKAAADLMVEPDDLAAILDFFFSEALNILSECEAGMKSADFDSLKKLFHSLKGSSSNFRMHGLQDMAARLEEGAAARDLGAIIGLLPAFRQKLLLIRDQASRHRTQ